MYTGPPPTHLTTGTPVASSLASHHPHQSKSRIASVALTHEPAQAHTSSSKTTSAKDKESLPSITRMLAAPRSLPITPNELVPSTPIEKDQEDVKLLKSLTFAIKTSVFLSIDTFFPHLPEYLEDQKRKPKTLTAFFYPHP